MNKLKQKILWALLALSPLWAGAGFWLWREAHRPLYHVALFEGLQEKDLTTRASTVAGVLREQGIALRPQDVVAPELDSPVTEGLEIDLGLVERRQKQTKRTLVHPVDVQYTDDLDVGEIIDVQEGRDGLEDQTTEAYFLNGQEAFAKVLKSDLITAPKDAKVLEGTSLRQKLYRLAKRARVRKIVTMNASAYYPGPEDTWPYASGYTSTHLKAGYGVAAVDPRFIRLKTPLYVEGYGYAVAGDVGGAIKGNRIDLCFDTYEQAVQFGRKNVKVYILR
ncbi:MAG TPA: 3D domain-containing protein [bacterium]|nr:3D domain-containing protein [bacterium]